MSVRVMSLVFEAELPDVAIQNGDRTVTAPIQKLVLLALADHASDEGESAYPSLSRLERKTALARRSVIRALEALKLAGYITGEGISKRGTVTYSINLPALESLVTQGHPLHQTSVPGTLPLVTQGHSPGDPRTPEPSLNHPSNIIESVLSAKNLGETSPPLFYLRTAVECLNLDHRRLDAFEQRVTGAEMDGATIVVHGLGDRAGYYQERWGKTLGRSLVGILDQPDAAVRFATD